MQRILLISLFLLLFMYQGFSQTEKVRAPELNGGVSWLNTDKPLSLAALKGKIVLLDFWTYGCINCIHIIPDLKKLEAKYGNNLVVIGVHSAKFDNEKNTENIRQIILRYEIEHPIVNDADFQIWNQYAVNAWPTLTLIDQNGYIIGQVSGEGHYDTLDEAIGKTIAEAKKRGELNEQPLKLALERAKVGDLPLAFPGKVFADEKFNRLFIADSNHNRIVITDLNGKLREIVGSGKAALKDGNFAEAAFFRPQGLFLEGETLFVADTNNHAIRRIDLKAKKVETIAGTGKQAAYRSTGGAAKTSAVSSPWDLVKIGNNIFIAMAGNHQIWKLDLQKSEVAPFAGSGAEARYDADLENAAFAQPSGIAASADKRKLYVADTESNIIRVIDLEKGEVETLAGGDLFDFGDIDGTGDKARLQHPLGVLVKDGKLLIADTYNHKLKSLDLKTNIVKTLFGNGKSGQTDGANAQFYEPAGISLAGNKLYVADTNNHAIRVVNLANKQVSTLKIEGLTPPIRENQPAEDDSIKPNLDEAKVETQKLKANAEVNLIFYLDLPKGFHLNESAPQKLKITAESGTNSVEFSGTDAKSFVQTYKNPKLPLRVSFRTGNAGASELNVRMNAFYCREDNTGTCQIKTLVRRVPIEVSDANTATEIILKAVISQ